MDATADPPSREKIDAIIARDSQPVIRNLQITQCYHELSQAIAAQVGVDNLNWCSFASWASKTAGRFIRNDEILPIFRDAFKDVQRLAEKVGRINEALSAIDPGAGLSLPTILDAMEAPVSDVSRYITAGNLAVFAELGPLFSLMCTRLADAAAYDGAALTRLIDDLNLKPGLPEQGGQSLLSSAVSHFYEAKFTVDPSRKAELMLLANAQTGLHEQVRLQPSIAGSLNLPFEAVLRSLYDRHHDAKFSGTVRNRLSSVVRFLLRPLFRAVEDELNQAWRECATRLFMTLRLPNGELHLGRDLRPVAGQPLFPAALQHIELDELRGLLAAYHADGSSADGSAAEDWADIPERMHFILTLFRSRQQCLLLFEQPFGDAQRAAIAIGRLPEGPL
jgi:hypothetical protein